MSARRAARTRARKRSRISPACRPPCGPGSRSRGRAADRAGNARRRPRQREMAQVRRIERPAQNAPASGSQSKTSSPISTSQPFRTPASRRPRRARRLRAGSPRRGSHVRCAGLGTPALRRRGDSRGTREVRRLHRIAGPTSGAAGQSLNSASFNSSIPSPVAHETVRRADDALVLDGERPGR